MPATIIGFSACPPWGSILTHQATATNTIKVANDLTLNGDDYSAQLTPGDATYDGFWRLQGRGDAGVQAAYGVSELFLSFENAIRVAPASDEYLCFMTRTSTGAFPTVNNGNFCLTIDQNRVLHIYDADSCVVYGSPNAFLENPTWTSTAAHAIDEKYTIRLRPNLDTQELQVIVYNSAGTVVDQITITSFVFGASPINRIYFGISGGPGFSGMSAMSDSTLSARLGTMIVSTGDFPPLNTRVGILMAASDGFHNTGYVGEGSETTDLYTHVNGKPPSSATYLRSTAVDDIYSCGVQTFAEAGIPANAVPLAISPFHAAHDEGGVVTISPGVRVGSTDDIADPSDPGATQDFHLRGVINNLTPVTGGPLTIPGIEAMQVITKHVTGIGVPVRTFAMGIHVVYYVPEEAGSPLSTRSHRSRRSGRAGRAMRA